MSGNSKKKLSICTKMMKNIYKRYKRTDPSWLKLKNNAGF